ncbi:hypothetical protein B0H14DRAFT_2766679 [Mycena olivaceomarginata]|nr:hypothetical protein B0H14DRAFT_2766679 [Mycena olivaceomarginata]
MADVAEALRKLKEERGLEIYVHANGTTRLQLDIVRSSGLNSTCVGLLKLRADECVTVAAHTSDLRAQRLGHQSENDAYLEDMQELDEVISKL